MSRPLLPAVLIIAVLAGQLAAACHGIDHLAAPLDEACAQCLHQPVQKHGVPQPALDLRGTTTGAAIAHVSHHEVHAEPHLPWSARAPPAVSC